MSTDSNIVVAVRVRPFNQREIGRGAKCIIKMEGPTTTIFNPDLPDDEGRKFTFDYSYWSFDKEIPGKYASQEKLQSDIGAALCDNALEGYNTSIFAYGQTGSGKSYSMMGGSDDPGIIPRICNSLFERLGSKQAGPNANHTNRVEVSYLEIYNEAVRDLLNPTGGKNLKVREHPTLGVFVEDLRTIMVTSFKEMENLIDIGQRTRTVASTAMNATSSRSHSIFSVLVTQTRLAGADADAGAALASDVTSKVNLVDLAGSERQASTGAVGDRLKEGCAINKSLSSLGNVISALAENSNAAAKGKKPKFVPYRDSVLTRLLQQSLGGNSKTAMIAALSPADINYEETLSTLRYADRAKRIVNKAVINEEPNERLIRELRAEIERLKALLDAQGNAAGNTASPTSPGVDPAVIAERDRLREEMALQQKLIEQMSMSAEARLKHQSEMGFGDLMLDGDGTGEDRKGPHFINLHEDPALSEKVAYPLKPDGGSTTFGKRASAAGSGGGGGGGGKSGGGGGGGGGTDDPDHELRGLGVASPHCVVRSSKGDEMGLVLEPVTASGNGGAAIPATFVNGKQVKGPTPLRHGDRVLLGVNHYFRVVVPGSIEDRAWAERRAAKGGDGDNGEIDGEIDPDRRDWEYAVDELSKVNGGVPSVGGDQDKETQKRLRELEDTLEKQKRAAEEQLEKERREASEAATEEAQAAFRDREAELAEANRRLETQLLKAKVAEAERQRKLVLEDTLVRTQNMCTEANSIATEIGREVTFEPKVITVFDRSGTQGPAAGVRFFDRTTGKAAIWDFEKFQTRLYLMREVYAEFQEWEPRNDDEVFGIIPESDPFYDPPGSQLIGRAQVLLEALGFGLEIDDRYPLHDYFGRSMGFLTVCITPTTLKGEEVDCPDDNPMELLGERLRFTVEVKGADTIPSRVDGDIHARFRFDRDIVTETDSVPIEKGRALFKCGPSVFDIDINVEVLDHWREDCLSIEVYGDWLAETDPEALIEGRTPDGSSKTLEGSPVSQLIAGGRRKRAISLSGLSSVLAPLNRAAAGAPSRQGSHLSPLAAADGAGGDGDGSGGDGAGDGSGSVTDGDPNTSGAAVPNRSGSNASARGRSPFHGVFVSEHDGESLLSASGRFTTIPEERLLELEEKAKTADEAKGKLETREKELETARETEAQRAQKLAEEKESAVREKAEKEAELRRRIEELEKKLEETEVETARKIKAKDDEIKVLTEKANKSKACVIQ